MTSAAPSHGAAAARGAAGAPKKRRPLPNTRLKNIVALAFGLAALPFIPFWPIFMAITARDAYYVNHYFETLWHCFKSAAHLYKNGSWSRQFKYNLWRSPQEVEEALGERMGACTRCAKCCKMLQCEYLAYDRTKHEYFCSIYDTKFWHFGPCGRYPIDPQDIDDYNCPGFVFPESIEKARGAGPAGALIQIGKIK